MGVKTRNRLPRQGGEQRSPGAVGSVSASGVPPVVGSIPAPNRRLFKTVLALSLFLGLTGVHFQIVHLNLAPLQDILGRQ